MEILKHRLPPPTHYVEKQSQIKQQCDKLLELGVIRHSTASEWSQVTWLLSQHQENEDAPSTLSG